MTTFGFIGAGKISRYHKSAIECLGAEIKSIYDPALYSTILDDNFFDGLDYVSICSPTYLHYDHIKLAISHGVKVIVEKPMVLPWQPIIDSEDVSVVMQLRWLSKLENVKKVRVKFVRDNDYFNSWHGDPRNDGGLFFNLFIHYVDLALRYSCEFEGIISSEGTQFRQIDEFDIASIDMGELYASMYADIILHDSGVKPKDVALLHWVLGRYTEAYGAGREILNKQININFGNGNNKYFRDQITNSDVS